MEKLLVFFSFLFFSCGGPKYWSDGKTAVFFLRELQNRNFDEAKKYCNSNSSLFIDTYLDSDSIKLVKLENVGCDFKDDTAYCEFCCTNTSNSKFKMVRKTKDSYKNCGWEVTDLSGLLPVN